MPAKVYRVFHYNNFQRKCIGCFITFSTRKMIYYLIHYTEALISTYLQKSMVGVNHSSVTIPSFHSVANQHIIVTI